ncbi:MAG: ribonuclease HII [Anaerovoracaceae bacterium]|jgi:ribonuclease HII
MKKEERDALLRNRLTEMRIHEENLYTKGIDLVAGVDEVGRGPLAGPVVAAAIILPADFNVLGIDDSKKLSEKKREELFGIICRQCLGYGLGVVDNKTIDRINILEATKLAMKFALIRLCCHLEEGRNIEHILVDALTLEDVEIPQTAIVGGDGKSISIAAASIVAKCTRDRMMLEYDRMFPGYSFHSNKGYGTRSHYEGIDKLGLCPIHRKSFLKRYVKEG